MEHLWDDKTPENTPVIAFKWRDIRKVERWDSNEEEVRPARKLVSAGFLLYHGPDPDEPDSIVTVIAETWDGEEETWHGITCFPAEVSYVEKDSDPRHPTSGEVGSR